MWEIQEGFKPKVQDCLIFHARLRQKKRISAILLINENQKSVGNPLKKIHMLCIKNLELTKSSPAVFKNLELTPHKFKKFILWLNRVV